MNDHRIIHSGIALDFTCENRRFKTDTTQGFEHYAGHGYKGSVTELPLYDDGEYSLWLEHVVDKINGNNCYWFMWYNDSGISTIPLSSVMDKNDLSKVIDNICKINLTI